MLYKFAFLVFSSIISKFVRGIDVSFRYHQLLTKFNNSLTVASHGSQHRTRIGHTISSSKASFITNEACKHLDWSSLTEVLEVDPISKTILVEAGCSMEDLVVRSLEYDLIPCVVPELKGMTVGGAIVGSALESSSFRYGQFNDIAKRIWILTGDGSIVCCHRDKKEGNDLWCALSGSYGTLGRVLCAEIECISIPKNAMVEVSTHRYQNLTEAMSFMQSIALNGETSIDFIDGINYPGDRSSKQLPYTAIITGKIISADQAGRDTIRYDPEVAWSLWYYEKIQKHIGSSRKLLIPLRSYVFRYDRGAFWMARPLAFSLRAILRSPLIAPLFIMTHNNPISRLFGRWFFTTKRLYALLRKAHPLVIRKRMVIMDVYVAADSANKLIEFTRDKIPITTPIWLCPVRAVGSKHQSNQAFSPHGIYKNQEALYIDAGIYGRVIDNNGWKYTRLLDEWTLLNPARKMVRRSLAYCYSVYQN
jgi:Delta24-sterol reductase